MIETIRCYEGRNHARGEIKQLFTKIYRCKRCTNTWNIKPDDHNCKDNIKPIDETTMYNINQKETTWLMKNTEC